MPGTGHHFHPESVESFLESIEAVAVDLNDLDQNAGVQVPNTPAGRHRDAAKARTSIVFADVLQRVTGQPKPIGPAIGLMLDGTIPFAIQKGDSFTESILISFKHVEIFTSLIFRRKDFKEAAFADRMTRRDALDMLNIRGHRSPLLDGLEANGVNPKTYNVEDVERLAENFVSLSEIAMRLGVSVQVAYSHLHKMGELEVTPGGWDREALNDIINAI